MLCKCQYLTICYTLHSEWDVSGFPSPLSLGGWDLSEGGDIERPSPERSVQQFATNADNVWMEAANNKYITVYTFH